MTEMTGNGILTLAQNSFGFHVYKLIFLMVDKEART